MELTIQVQLQQGSYKADLEGGLGRLIQNGDGVDIQAGGKA